MERIIDQFNEEKGKKWLIPWSDKVQIEYQKEYIMWLEKKIKSLIIGNIINWKYFEDKKPNYGDEILLEYPPESKKLPTFTIYKEDTDWIYGCRYIIINLNETKS